MENKTLFDFKKLQKLCFINRDEYFDITENNVYLLERFSNRLGDSEKDPFVGFIGSNYGNCNTRVLFLGRSGAESDESLGFVSDEAIYEKFKVFKNAKQDIKKHYRKYADQIFAGIVDWRIYQFPKYFLDHTGLTMNDTAYANILPYRYKGAPTVGACKIAFKCFTNEFISIVKPNLIVPLGANLGSTVVRFVKNFNGKITNGISRTNGDRYIDEQGYKSLNNAINDFNRLSMQ